MITINENKPIPVLITLTIKRELKAEPSIADLSAIKPKAIDHQGWPRPRSDAASPLRRKMDRRAASGVYP
jgi:hypothetical protein